MIDTLKYIQMQIVIEDNGIGIKEENLSKIFTDYTMLKEHKKLNKEGTGLGLSICNNIVNKMGGQITVKSTEGVGTEFAITL